MTLEELVKELVHKHAVFYHRYGQNIPSSVLSFSAGEYLDVISNSRSSEDAYKNTNRITTAEVLYKDFIDPIGNDEMSRIFNKII